jgi:hypothetical protein
MLLEEMEKIIQHATYIDIATNTQVAEYKGQISKRIWIFFSTGLASEYNNAMLVVENA